MSPSPGDCCSVTRIHYRVAGSVNFESAIWILELKINNRRTRTFVFCESFSYVQKYYQRTIKRSPYQTLPCVRSNCKGQGAAQESGKDNISTSDEGPPNFVYLTRSASLGNTLVFNFVKKLTSPEIFHFENLKIILAEIPCSDCHFGSMFNGFHSKSCSNPCTCTGHPNNLHVVLVWPIWYRICFELHRACCSDLERLLWSCALGMKISKNISLSGLKGGFLKPKRDQPVNSWDSIMGAIDGPCNGHLALSHVRLIEASAVGQMNSSPWLSQTGAESPAQNVHSQM